MTMTDGQRQALRAAFRIVDEFRELLEKEIQEKQNMLLMSSGHESLDTALGLLGSLDPGLDTGLTVGSPETRQAIGTAYAHLEAVLPNTVDGSPAQQACCQMQAALFTVLNMRWTGNGVQAALEKAMAAARFGLDIAEAISDAGEGAMDDGYLNPSGQTLTAERTKLLADTFRQLLPEAGQQTDGGEDHEDPEQQEEEAGS